MKKIYPLLIIILLGVFSCQDDKHKKYVQHIITEWQGKQIQFSDNYQCSFIGRDTSCSLCSEILSREYKILLYMDSTGCTPCKLHLSEWKKLMHEADSLFAGKSGFVFIFYPQNKKELYFLLNRDQMNYPVFIDTDNKIYQLNKFPEQSEYQCFLLDRNNRVISLGNPANNYRVWKLYKQIITGEISDSPPVTTVEPEQTEIKLKNMRVGKTSATVFKLKNTGNQPFIIKTVDASCGCTVPDWEKQPVKAGKVAEIKVQITPAETGYFNKTVTVHCNNEQGQILLKVTGAVE